MSKAIIFPFSNYLLKLEHFCEININSMLKLSLFYLYNNGIILSLQRQKKELKFINGINYGNARKLI